MREHFINHLHQLHLATEIPEHPPPVVERVWYRVLIAVLGFLLGAAVGLGAWLASSVVAVATRGIERWVTQQLAVRAGICANVQFPSPRAIVAEAEKRRQLGRGTILFADEIHRFNKAQQDAFLPHVEAGTITLIGATTENPSFEIIGALLSRVRVFVLQALDATALRTVIERALADTERGLGNLRLEVDDAAIALLADEADGDARRALQVAAQQDEPEDLKRFGQE